MLIALLTYGKIKYVFFTEEGHDEYMYACYDDDKLIEIYDCDLKFINETINHAIDMVGYKTVSWYTADPKGELKKIF